MTDMRKLSITEVRPKLGQLARQAAKGERTAITDNGEVVAVLVPLVDHWDREDAMAILHNQNNPEKSVVFDDQFIADLRTGKYDNE